MLATGTDTLMDLIGVELAKMHQADVIHGDLTTSNMMLRHPSSFTPLSATFPPTELVRYQIYETYEFFLLSCTKVLIDFGLSYYSRLAEDRAVDLYVLERAFSSTHPEASRLFAKVLKAYEVTMGMGWGDIARRLEDGTYLLGLKRLLFSP